jgi:hypothetical protein
MTPETYYTIRRIQSPCKSESGALFDLTYRRVWRPELGDQRVSGATCWWNKSAE